MALDLAQYGNSWDQLTGAVTNNLKIVGDGGIQDSYVPSLSGVSTSAITPHWADTGIDSLTLANPDKPGWDTTLYRNPDGTIGRKDYEQQNGLAGVPWGALALVAPAVAAVAGVAAAGTLAGSTAAADVGGSTVFGLEDLGIDQFASDLPDVSNLTAEDFAGDAVSGDTFANETNKLLQQASSDSSVSTDLPSFDTTGTDSALSDSTYANETNKLLQQQTIADNGGDLLNTSLPTVDLSMTPTLPDLPRLPSIPSSPSSPRLPTAPTRPATTSITTPGTVPGLVKTIIGTLTSPPAVRPTNSQVYVPGTYVPGTVGQVLGPVRPYQPYLSAAPTARVGASGGAAGGTIAGVDQSTFYIIAAVGIVALAALLK